MVRRFCGAIGLAGLVVSAWGQSVVTWSSNSDQRWSRSANWSGGNRPDTSGEIAQFGTGNQLNPELNSNSYTVRGIRFGAGADSYTVADDNGARLLRIGNGSSGFIENLSSQAQAIAIATLQFQSDATLSTAGGGQLAISSNLTGSNRDLTFAATGDITVTGNIATGTGTLTKDGSGNLNLSGSNTYTGTTNIDAGAIILQGSDVFADTNRVDIATGASLRLNGYDDAIGRLTGSGSVDFGGDGRLTLASGISYFAGAFNGSGELVVGAGATLILGADFINRDLQLTLDGGNLWLAGHEFTLGDLEVTDDSMIDFGWGGFDSTLDVLSLGFAASDLGLTVASWSDAADFFYSQAAYTQAQAPLNQVEFQGWDTGDTKWQPYDRQITPVPEPATYGAVLLAVLLGIGWHRRRSAGRGEASARSHSPDRSLGSIERLRTIGPCQRGPYQPGGSETFAR
ncbi:MAG TPA: autotransporter-associated beta strand repeat-containing protein [Lacunisphaera sp.]|nr:autotransporter-associated beta strand repeat-containing protein [Lacunisphaera sp.]